MDHLLLTVLMLCVPMLIFTVNCNGQDIGDVQITSDNRLQVYYYNSQSEGNKWIDVCYDGFNDGAAAAACRQLGYVNYDGYNFTNTTVSLAFKSITCPTVSNYTLYGELAILRCSIGDGPKRGVNCNPVNITCTNQKLHDYQPYEGQVYLNHQEPVTKSNGVLPVGIYWNNDWHHICYNATTFANHNVGTSICRQLGYTNLISLTQHHDVITQSFLNFENLNCLSESLPCFSHCITDVIVTQDCHDNLIVHIHCGFDMAYLMNSSGSETLCKNNAIYYQAFLNYKKATFIQGAIFLAAVIAAVVTILIMYFRKDKCCGMMFKFGYNPADNRHLLPNDKKFKLTVFLN